MCIDCLDKWVVHTLKECIHFLVRIYTMAFVPQMIGFCSTEITSLCKADTDSLTSQEDCQLEQCLAKKQIGRAHV